MKPWYLKWVLWFFSTVSYRVEALRADRLPAQGGALLVSNHVSFVDMLLILASTRRFVWFLIPAEICELRLLRPWLKMMRVIPLPPDHRSGDQAATLRRAGELIRQGEVVGIFAERNISRIGVLLPFRREFEKIMEGVEAPIIPVCLDGVWGSVFSHQAGRFFWKVPRGPRFPVTVSFGEPMPATATAVEVRAGIQALNTEAWPHRRRTMLTLGRAFVQSARHHPFRFAMADARVPKLSFGGALVKTVFLARRFREHWRGQKMVGICLPPSVGGALVNFAALLAGKVPVNLNYTLSAETLASCARQCELQTVVSAKVFLDRLKLAMPCRTLLLEEIAARPRAGERAMAAALAWLAPVRWLENAVGCERAPQLDDLATVVFSSGSTGDPKGVMLSHYNLGSNILQIGQTFDFGPGNRFLGVLPFFHSFGFTATLLAPALTGFGVVFHSNPLESKVVGDLVRRFSITTLMAPPGFLQFYLKACEPADFGSVTFIMAGAEKLQEWLATEFQKKFRISLAEGYGCTECSPAISVNTHDFRGPGIQQIGSRQGTIGRPMPGVSVRVVDPESRKSLPVGQPGLLLVRGPNVMQGYLNRPEKTAEVLRDGWYETGDIAAVHPDGFLEITDRLSRFSKIAGEMVPHVKVEEKLQALAGVRETVFAVVGVPDESRGERLVVLHKLPDDELAEVLRGLPDSGLPNLWIPKAGQFYKVDEIPLLGSGKLDLRALRETASRLAGENAREPKAAARVHEVGASTPNTVE